MPELPDVEVYKRYVDATALKQAIAAVEVFSPDVLDHLTPQALGRHLKDKAFTRSQRHGKYLFLRAGDDGWLVLHFGMTGWLQYQEKIEPRPKGTGLQIHFTNGAMLRYIAPRKLGHIAWSEDPQAFIESKKLGPDAYSIDLATLRELAARRKGVVKSWLMDQKALAGIGNVYSDEILLRARIHPQTTVQKLDQKQLAQLHRAMRQILEQAIAAQADPERMPRSFLLPRREAGAPCPLCQGKIERLSAGGRGAYYCPACQTKT